MQCFLARSVAYSGNMSRMNIDLDDQACAEVMRRYQLTTQSEAINFALRKLVSEALTVEEALAMRGSGWDDDLGAMRATRRF